MEKNVGIIPFFDGDQKRWEIFYSAEEAFGMSGLEEADDDEAQLYRIACLQSYLCQYAKKHDDFVAIRAGKGQPMTYGFTEKERLKIADTTTRNRRAEKQIEDAGDRSERMVAKYPKREAELQIEIPKMRTILIKKRDKKILKK